MLVKSYWIVNFTVFSELTVKCKIYFMYSVQFIVMSILQCTVKCIVHWRGGSVSNKYLYNKQNNSQFTVQCSGAKVIEAIKKILGIRSDLPVTLLFV